MAKRTNKATTNATKTTPVIADAPEVVDAVVVATKTEATSPAVVDLSNLDILGGLGGIAPTTPTKAAKAAKVPGVAPNARTRAYFAGLVVGGHGHAAGVTPEMVAEVNALYGATNNVESEICLRNAWHAIRGFAAAGGTLPAAPAPAAVTGANG